MVGEIGGNDYNYAFFQGKTIEEVRHMVLEIVQAIKDVVNVILFFSKQNNFFFLAKWLSMIIDSYFFIIVL